MPEISIIMPMYNSEKYVGEAINSLLSQTFTDFEIIAINDGSKDNCARVVSNIVDERLVFIDDPENHGFLPTLNRCISLAKGKYIARLDDDDISYPSRLEKQYEYMESHPEVVLCGTLFDYMFDGEIKRVDMPPIYTNEQLRFSLASGNRCIPHSSFMMRKEALIKNDIKYETYLQVPDYHMQTAMSEVGELHCIREPLVVYRVYSEQSTAIRSSKMKWGEIDRARLWYIHRLPISDKDKAIMSRAIVRRLRTPGDYREYIDTMEHYSEQCGMGDSVEDKECISYILKAIFSEQRRSPSILAGCRYAKRKGYDIRFRKKERLSFVFGFHPGFVKSDYEESDDGMTDRHHADK